MPFACIRKEQIDQFKKALKGKDVDVFKLVRMSTEERTALLEKYVGKDNVKAVNTLFEEKLILKNKLQGIKNWVAKVGEVGRYDPKRKVELERMMSDYKAKQQERMFSPKEDEAFLADLVEEKFGTRITPKEAKNIFDLQSKADELKVKFNDETGKWTSQKDRLQYGMAEWMTRKYSDALADGNLSLKELLKESLNRTKSLWKTDKPQTVIDVLSAVAKTVSQNIISILASWDNSFIGRQGMVTLKTHPGIWADMAKKSFSDIAKELKGKDSRDALMADTLSRENYLNGEYEKAGILPKTEEQFPTSLPEKMPGVLGRGYTASERAFNNSGMRARTELYDKIKATKIDQGIKWDDKSVSDSGRLVGAMTARGKLPQNAMGQVMQATMWAPKMVFANLEVLTGHRFGLGLKTNWARRVAAQNLLKIIGTTATVMAISNAIKPGSAELDPRSSNFGKLKYGTTTFDLTGGQASLVTLAARLITMSSKSASSGVVSKFSGEYGAQTGLDTFVNFMAGKSKPFLKPIIDYLAMRTMDGKKVTLGKEIYSSSVPIFLQNAIELKDDNSANAIIGVILDGLGVNANTYIPEEDWSTSSSKQMTEFRDLVDKSTLNKANDDYNKRVNKWLQAVRYDPAFSTLDDDAKKEEITKQKKSIKSDVITEYSQ
jgi:hypothetical protein